MITHIVLFKLKDRNGANIEKARQALAGLTGKVPVLKHLEVGVDVVKSDRSHDIALLAKFDSLKDLAAYQNHPEHLKAGAYIKSVAESVAAVDYES